MSRETVVASRYARALFEIAGQEGRTLELEQELEALVEVMSKDQEIHKFILSPNISAEAKWNAIVIGLQGNFSQPVISLMKMLIERGRTAILPEVLSSYTKITGEAIGLADARVYSTYSLSEEEKREVAEQLQALVGKKIRIINEVDKELLGGMKVKIGDTVYDGSLSSKLERLEKSFRRQAL